MIAFVFPGQGAQYVGMGKEFYDQFPAAKQVFEEASDMLSFDMSRLCFEDNTEKLNLTANAQPAILTASIAALRVLNQETGIRPDFVAGHSLGEYSALVASGAMNFKDAVHTVRKRGEFMQSAVPIGIGAMAAVIGLSKEEIENICERVTSSQSIVSSANYNSPQQTVISGHKEAVQRAEGMLKEAGAKRIVPLSVSAPFHCKLMNKAAENLSEVLNDIQVSEIETPVVTNVESIANSDKTRVKDLLVQQVVKPVRWFESIQYLAEQKVKNFVEIGPGKVLTGLIRKTIKEVNLINLENITQLAHIKKMEFKDKVALITGASRGIGREVALELASKGAKVILNYLKDDESAQKTASLISNNGGSALLSKFDVSNYENVQKRIGALIDDLGKIDLLVNNAGTIRDSLFMRMNEEDWDMLFNINMKGAFNCTKAVIRNMSRKRYGRIVNVVSVVGEIGNPGQANYSATKAGLIGFTKSIAKEFASRNITVNAVSPGFIDTDITKDLTPDLKKKYMDAIPLGRFGKPEDVSGIIAFLLSDNASYITGEVVKVNGGVHM